ncbi:MAG: hypothetical protein BWK72_07900 [Rhodoferax ferrireducens]|uniref:PEP-CTERM protein-sorting domain-containing protein n=2 Tax=Pseudomonadota TaxID=1224 RepID=A0A1Y1R085_9GAMM|nr:MAG: hypothetical protein BWK72_07900 [Rhodoferax ferrireducens]OQX17408.1 MAG: hypothetical protein BWK73_01680 [Thiothrix lacustris]
MKLKLRNFLLAATLALLAPLAAHAGLQSMSSLYVFGDSLSDGGNYAGPGGIGAFPPYPYAGARYSNGQTAVENLWRAFNPLDNSFMPSNYGGTNYALGGATTGTTNFNSVNPSVPTTLQPWFDGQGGVSNQVAQFASGCSGCITDPATSLFVIWAFANDVFYNAALASVNPTLALSVPTLIGNGVTNIANAITTLAAEGAQHFLIPNLPDLGITPAFLGTGQADDLSTLTAAYNGALASALNALGQAMSSIEIIQFDVFGLVNDAVANPAQYGFTNVTEQCVVNLTNGRCSNPDNWLFWDGVHPTAAGHALLGERFAAAVPEPATWWLLLPALVLLARRRLTGARAT